MKEKKLPENNRANRFLAGVHYYDRRNNDWSF